MISVVLISNDNSSEAIEHALQIGSACLTGSWVPAEPHFSKFGPPGGRTLADLLRPQTHDLFAEGRPGRTLADLLRPQTHDTFLRRAGREAWTL